MLTPAHTQSAVRAALMEDAPWGDVTARLVISDTATMTAAIRAREPGVFAGGAVLTEAFRQVDPRITVSALRADATAFAPGDVLAEVTGPARGILTAERVALNFVQRMSGIATLTSQYVAEVERVGAHARIADTRKTVPGLRVFDKYSVTAGGGSNHRFGLSDAIMVKDNHLAVLGGDITAALIELKRRAGHTTSIIVEVDRLEQIDAVRAARPTGILLDNFSISDLRAAVALIDGAMTVEASGGVTLGTVAEIASTGVDVISVGALTHSVRALDLGLDAR
ncbi:carboxylating nicotinate-nucleotide diphosphorylase [Corynebacterium pacaense]|uniref:carboxylating nicotinate-nucleotide diphosphorylase n=1 Tax=Corynebacterium pacaense TaxID=1816684 RepID=UPI0009BB845E|nr:carboxylating nicotinate-nucleotide diphosphorylase [Corynebacterium pacaense]